MDPRLDAKLEKLFSLIAEVKEELGLVRQDVALIKQRDENVERRLNSQEGRMDAVDEAVLGYKLERAKIIGGAFALSTVTGAILSFLFWLFGIKH